VVRIAAGEDWPVELLKVEGANDDSQTFREPAA
jgi:hypothetical protein